jgi:hypothetical protein
LDIVKRRRSRSKETYEVFVYPKEEADKLGFEYVYWKDATKTGQYVITDDEWVTKVISVKEYHVSEKCRANARIFKHVLTEIGPMFTRNKNGKLEYLERKKYNNFYDIKPRRWIDREVKMIRTRRMVKLYAYMKLANNIDYDRLGKEYRPDQAIPAATVKRLLKYDEVKAMIHEEIVNILKDKGIDKTTFFDWILLAQKIAAENKDPKYIIEAAKVVEKYTGLERALYQGDDEVTGDLRMIEGQILEDDEDRNPKKLSA